LRRDRRRGRFGGGHRLAEQQQLGGVHPLGAAAVNAAERLVQLLLEGLLLVGQLDQALVLLVNESVPLADERVLLPEQLVALGKAGGECGGGGRGCRCIIHDDCILYNHHGQGASTKWPSAEFFPDFFRSGLPWLTPGPA